MVADMFFFRIFLIHENMFLIWLQTYQLHNIYPSLETPIFSEIRRKKMLKRLIILAGICSRSYTYVGEIYCHTQ